MVRLWGLPLLLYLAALAGCFAERAGAVVAPDTQPNLEQALRDVDMEQARLVLKSDVAGLTGLFHPSYVAHAPNGRVYSLDQVLALVRDGSLARERFQRTQEIVTISGTTGVVVGVDRLEEPPPLARNGERTRRYTNIYVMHEGRWRLLARHFHLLP